MLIGTFCFRNKTIMKNLLEYTFKNKIKIKNEYYMDSLMRDAFKLKYKLSEITVHKYISLGSYKELKKLYFKMISLVIPCYNEEDNLEKLLTRISSLLKEFSQENIELVIVNNGSTDNSEQIIKNHELFKKKI